MREFHAKTLVCYHPTGYERELEKALVDEQRFLGPEWVLVSCTPIGNGSMSGVQPASLGIYERWATVWRTTDG